MDILEDRLAPAGILSFTTEPAASAVAGGTLSPVVKVVNMAGAPEPGIVVSLSISSSALAGTTSVVTSAAGFASFSVDVHAVGTYTLIASVPGFATVQSTSLIITPGAPVLSMTQPGTVLTNTNFADVVTDEDSFGNPIAGSTITVGVSSGSLSGTTTATTDSTGQAFFTALQDTTAGNGLRLNANTTGAAQVVSNTFNVVASSSYLTFSTQPNNTVSGNTLGTVTVNAFTAGGAALAGVNVTMNISSGTLNGTTTVATNAAGTATFTGLTVNQASNYLLLATANGVAYSASSEFTISPAVANHLVFAGQPISTLVNSTINPVVVEVEDAKNNLLTNVVVTIATSIGTLTGTNTATTDANGLATFPGLSISAAGTAHLTASSAGVANLNSSAFSSWNVDPVTLSFSTQPNSVAAGSTLNVITVLAQDDLGNKLANLPITIAASGGTLNGTTTLTTGAGGTVSFNNLSINQAGNYVLMVSAANAYNVQSNGFTVNDAALAGSILTLVTPPASSITTGSTFCTVVQVTDAKGNPLSGVAVNLTASAGSLSGTIPQTTNASGLAYFSDLQMATAVSFTLTASVTGGGSVTSGLITASAATAVSNLVFTGQPAASVTAGSSLGTVTVQALSAGGGNLAGVTVTLANSSGTLQGALTAVTNGSGIATFNGLSVNLAGGPDNLIAAASGLASAASSAFTVSTNSANELAFLNQVVSTTAGTAFNPLTVQVEDQYGNAVSAAGDTITLSSSASTLQGTLTATTGANGQAVFSGLALFPIGTYTLSAKSTGLSNASSNSFTITLGSDSVLSFVVQPATVNAGTTFPAVTAQIADKYGNVIPNVPINIAISSGAFSSGTLTITSNASGQSTYSDLVDTAANNGYRLIVSVTGLLTSDDSNTFNINALTPASIIFTTQPTNTTAGVTINSIKVHVVDKYGNVVSNAPINITTSPGALSGGTTPLFTNSGNASFNDLVENFAGTYTLVASYTGVGGPISASSSSFVVTPDLASAQMVMATQPLNTTAGATINPILMQVTDQYGNFLSGFSVSISISPGTLSTGTTPLISDGLGQVKFSDLTEDAVGTYTLTATSPGLTAAVSETFTISPGAGVFTYLSQPTSTPAGNTINPVTLLLADQYNNIITNTPVSIALSPAATLGGTTTATTDGTGKVVFNNLVETAANTYDLVAASAGAANGDSNPFTVTPLAASTLTVLSSPGNVQAGNTFSSYVVQATDKYGNPVSGVAVSVSGLLALAPGSTTTLTTDATGDVQFNNLACDVTGSETLTATATGLSPAVSSAFNVTPGASIVSFTQSPGNTGAGAAVGNVIVNVADQFGNVVTGDPVTISLSSGTFSSGTLVATTDGSGNATFTGLTEDTAGTYTIAATDATLATASSGSFVIAAGPAASLTYVSQPSGTTAGSTLNGVTVLALDQFNNPVPLTSIALAVASGPASFNHGTTPLTTNAAGEVIFNDLIFDTAGAYSLNVSTGGMLQTTSGSFTIAAAAPTTLAFTGQPSSVVAGNNLGPVTVYVSDTYGNAAPGIVVSVTIPSGSLTGTITATSDASGNAVFPSLFETKVGSYSLKAGSTGLQATASSSFTISAGSVAALTFINQPATTNSITALRPVTVQATDQYGNITAGAVIGIGISPGQLSAGTTPLTANAQGEAVFGDLMESVTGTYTLQATSPGLATPTSSNSFIVLPAPIAEFDFVTQPTTTAAGAFINAITVIATDINGNAVAGAAITMGVTSGAITGGAAQVTNAQGQVIFSTLEIGATGLYTLRASSSTASGLSAPFAVTSSADRLLFTVQPTTTPAGSPVNPVTVQFADPAGDKLPVAGILITLALSSGTLSGTTKAYTNGQGQATFSGFTLTKAGSYWFVASTPGYSNVNSNTFVVTGGAPAKFTFTDQPVNTTAGALMNTITVLVVDQYGNIVPNSPVIMSAVGGKLVGTTTVTTNASGQAIFSNLSETSMGTFSLTAATPADNLSITSSPFVVGAAAPSVITWLNEPTGTTAGSIFAPLTVKVSDKFGNVAPHVAVSLFVSVNTVNGSTLVTTNALGQAVFTNLFITKTATYTLSVSAPGIAKVPSSSFVITPAAGIVSFVNQPSNGTAGNTLAPVTVQMLDKYDNPLIGISVTMQSSAGILSGTTTAATSPLGQVVFNNLSLFSAGSYRLSASGAGTNVATSNTFSITGTAVSHMAFSTGPVNTPANTLMPPVVVQLDNANGTALVMPNVSVTLTISSGTLTGTVTVLTNDQGQAVFNNLVVPTKGTFTFTARATVGSQSLSVVSGSFTIS